MQLSTLITIVTLILMSVSPIIHAESPTQPPRWVSADDVRVRTGPGPDYRIAGTLSRGAELILKAPPDAGDFCLIEGEGYYGYVACQFLSAEKVARPRAGENGVDAAQRWVSGNGVTLREEPRPDAAVVSRLSLNAIVKLLREEAGSSYCEVQSADGLSGFTACRYLAPTPVVMAHILGYGGNGEVPPADYDPERAFWLEPSWHALAQYAEHLRTLHPEIPPEGPWPRNEALEKMKAHLALGLKGNKPAPYVDWATLKRPQVDASTLQNAIGISGQLHDDDYGVRTIGLVRALMFPDVKPSLFHSEAELAPPITSTEEASGRFNIVYRQLVTPRPEPKPDAEEYSGAGLYDMLARTQTLVRPVQHVRLFRDGRLRAEPSFVRVEEEMRWRDEDGPMCEGWLPGFSFGDADTAIWRYHELDSETATAGKPGKNHQESWQYNPAGSLFAFYTNITVPLGPALLTEIPVEMNRDETGFVRGTYLHYDLDGDGIADLAVWEGEGKGPGHLEDGGTTTDDRWYRLVLVNIAGKWKVLGSDNFGYGCGC